MGDPYPTIDNYSSILRVEATYRGKFVKECLRGKPRRAMAATAIKRATGTQHVEIPEALPR